MTPTAETTTPSIAVISPDRRPVEKAWIGEIMEMFDPYKFLTIWFHRPDGGARYYYAWTPGGDVLGDDIDAQAVARGYDGADWMDLTGRYETVTKRGSVEVRAVDLRPLADDIRLGVPGADDSLRDKLAFICWRAADLKPDQYRALRPGERFPWIGVGPRLVGAL